MSPVELRIDHFFKVLRNRIQELRQLNLGMNGGIYHKTLCVCMLDVLAKAAYRSNENRKRYTKLLRDFSGWPHVERVSLPYLDALLRKYPEVPCDELRDLVRERFTWRTGFCPTLDHDPDFGEVSEGWPKLKKPFGSIRAEDLRHDALFYRYRNSLVHEIRSPGFAFEEEEDREPYYHSFSPLCIDHAGKSYLGKEKWQLVYPTQFFLALVDRTMDRFERYCREKGWDPVVPFDFGDYWIEELND